MSDGTEARKSRTNSSGERSIIRLKPAFTTGRRKAASTRAHSIATPKSASPLPGGQTGRFGRKYRIVRLQYSPDLEAIQDISKNLDQVSDIVEALRQKSTPVGSVHLPDFPVTPLASSRPMLRAVEATLKVRKSTRPKVKSLMEGNAGISVELAKPTEALYKKRFEAFKVPVVKETKPKRESRKATLPFLRAGK